MKKMILSLAAAVMMSGCADFGNSIQRDIVNNVSGDYHIIQYSGGKIVAEYKIHNIKVTQNEHTDGVFFIYQGVQYELQGEVLSKRLKGFDGPDRVWELSQEGSPDPN